MSNTAIPTIDIADPLFWQRPLADRMEDFGRLRAGERFPRYRVPNILTGEEDDFRAVIGFDDVVAISRNAEAFCSGQGSISIQDMPTEAAEYFGSFITMDDPRHARQRGIVSRAFTPRRLGGVMDSIATICDEVIDAMCESGQADLVEAIAAPFPLLVICDMMGIPRSEFKTVLDATNIILSSGDPEFLGEGDPLMTLFAAGQTLTDLMSELAQHRRANPADDLTTALVHAKETDDMLAPEELGAFFILLAVAGNDTTRTAISWGIDLLAKWPEQRQRWQNDIDGLTGTAVEEIVRMSSPVQYMRRTVTADIEIGGERLTQGERLVLFYGAANRDPAAFDAPDTFDVGRDPNNHLGFGGPGPHFCLGAHLARREVNIMFRQLLTRLPDIETSGEPVYLEPVSVPLVGGIKRLGVTFTPQSPIGK